MLQCCPFQNCLVSDVSFSEAYLFRLFLFRYVLFLISLYRIVLFHCPPEVGFPYTKSTKQQQQQQQQKQQAIVLRGKTKAGTGGVCVWTFKGVGRAGRNRGGGRLEILGVGEKFGLKIQGWGWREERRGRCRRGAHDFSTEI